MNPEINKISMVKSVQFRFKNVFRLGQGIEQIQKVQMDTDRMRNNVEEAGKRFWLNDFS